MKKALPAIAVSAAGLTWLLHAQGVIDASVAPKSSNAAGSVATDAGAGGTPPPSRPSTTSTLPPRDFGGGDDEDGPVRPRPGGSTTTTARPSTTAGPSQGGNGNGNRVSDGPVIDTRYGPVQVEAVLQGSKLVDVKVLEYPNEARRSQAINNEALPMLHDQAMSAQNAQIDGVSGATYTSSGYQQSLQAALDSAK